MYFTNSKEEEAKDELRKMINQQYSEFVSRGDNPRVHFERIYSDSLPPSVRYKAHQRARIASIMFGEYFDEYKQERVHAIAAEMWEGRMAPEYAIMVIPVLKELHRKAVCDKCQDGHRLRIPTYETIEKAYRERNK